MIKYLIVAENNSKLTTLQSLLGPEYSTLCLNPHLDFSTLEEKPTKYTIYDSIQLSPKEAIAASSGMENIKKVFLVFDPNARGEVQAIGLRTIFKRQNISCKRLWLTELTKSTLEKEMKKKSTFDRSLAARFLILEYFDYLLHNQFDFSAANNIRDIKWIDVVFLYHLNNIVNESLNVQSKSNKIIGEFSYKGEKLNAILSAINDNVADIPDSYYLKGLISDVRQKQFKVDHSTKTVENIAGPECYNYADILLDANLALNLSFSKLANSVYKLYSGIQNSPGDEPHSFIAFPDVDTTEMNDSTKTRLRERIMSDFGVEYVKPVSTPKITKNNSASSIVPSTNLAPRQTKKWLSHELYALYKLIWNRAVASEMSDAKVETLTVDIADGSDGTYLFQAKEQAVLQRGFLAIGRSNGYLDNPVKSEFALESEIELLNVSIKKQAIKASNEIKMLLDRLSFLSIKKSDILKSIIRLENGGLVEFKSERYILTVTGQKVLFHLKEKNSELFQTGYVTLLDDLTNRISENEITVEQVLVQLEKLKDYKLSLQDHSNQKFGSTNFNKKCEKCGAPLIERSGKFGRFLACSTFPKCDYTQAITIGTRCPAIGCNGEVIERQTKVGKIFFGCSKYPTCNFSSWQKPINFVCPQCKNLYLVDTGYSYKCTNCTYTLVKKEGVPVTHNE